MALQDNLTNRGGQDWDIALRNAFDQADALIAAKADADHTHGAGGAVAGIGVSANRPAVAEGYIHSETDTGKVVVLKADGALNYELARAEDAALAAMIFGG